MREFRVGSGATELILVRHGEAQPLPIDEAFAPRDIDLPLSERGRVQAAAVAQRLSRRSIDAIYSSPLKRTRETAQPLSDVLALPVHEDERLREVEIAGVGPVGLHDLAEIAVAHGGWSHLPGTESSDSIRERMKGAMLEIVAAHPAQRVAVFSHAGAINAYIASLLDIRSDFFFPAGNTGISIVRARDERRLVVTLNDIAHLERIA